MNDLKHYGRIGMKWGKRTARAGGWLKEAGKLSKSSVTNPFLSDRANKESIATGNLKTKLRRSLLYQNTKELKDVNARIEQMKSNIAKQTKELQNNKTKGTALLGYKSSEDHAKDLVASWKAKNVREIAMDLTKGAGKAAVEFTVGAALVYGSMVALERLTRP